jgi:ribulose-5-phosphate 4-epimerase/fuculose-1-phosphate aldolase
MSTFWQQDDGEVSTHEELPCAHENDEATIRRHLAAVYRICHRLGLNEGVCNHLSALLPGEPYRFLVIRYGLGWDEVTADNLVLCDQDGNLLKGKGRSRSLRCRSTRRCT